MKTERRHELKENDLAEWLGRYIEQARPYSKTILAVVILACAAVIAGTIISRDQAAQNSLAWNAFFAAFAEGDADRLGDIAVDYPGKTAALWAKHSEANINLTQGIQSLFVDRAHAGEALEQARRGYLVVEAEAGSNAMLKQRALFGLAQVHEARSELDDARKYYSQVAANFPGTALAEEAAKRVEELDKPELQRWYNWFANQKPTPRAQLDPHSGLDLPDDLGGLSDRPDISFPRFGESEEMTPSTTTDEGSATPDSDPAPAPTEEAAEKTDESPAAEPETEPDSADSPEGSSEPAEAAEAAPDEEASATSDESDAAVDSPGNSE